jgi:hypothetical protein
MSIYDDFIEVMSENDEPFHEWDNAQNVFETYDLLLLPTACDKWEKRELLDEAVSDHELFEGHARQDICGECYECESREEQIEEAFKGINAAILLSNFVKETMDKADAGIEAIVQSGVYMKTSARMIEEQKTWDDEDIRKNLDFTEFNCWILRDRVKAFGFEEYYDFEEMLDDDAFMPENSVISVLKESKRSMMTAREAKPKKI